MATLTITHGITDGTALTEAQLDNFKTAGETFANTTKHSDNNFLAGGITASLKLATGSVDAACINALAVTTVKIADSAVTAAKINDLAITTAKILDGTITRAKLEAVGQVSATYTDSSTGTTEVSLGSVAITTTGRPVVVSLISSIVSGVNAFTETASLTVDAVTHNLKIRLYRDATLILETQGHFQSDYPAAASGSSAYVLNIPNGSIHTVDVVGAGTYTYAVKYLSSTSTLTQTAAGYIAVYEL